jgi:hypothetical protein
VLDRRAVAIRKAATATHVFVGQDGFVLVPADIDASVHEP